MSHFSNYLEDRLLGVTLLGSPFTAPSTIYVALATSCTTDGAVFHEVPAGTAYARQVVVFGAPAANGTATRCQNTASVTFPEATTPWGGVTHAGLYDSPTGGNQLYWGSLTTVRTILTADTFQYPIGQFSVSLD